MHPTFPKQKHKAGRGDIFSCQTTPLTPPDNGAVLNVAQIIKAIMQFVAESKFGALFINCRDAMPAQHTL